MDVSEANRLKTLEHALSRTIAAVATIFTPPAL
jgi:hypothetical protein